MRFHPSILVSIQGAVWLGVGVFLVCKGVLLITILLTYPEFGSSLFVKGASHLGGTGNGVVLLICLGLFIGWLKARFVLIRVIRKNVTRLLQMPSPIPLKKIYEGRYYLILALMISLGILPRTLGLKNDIHGFIALTIGAALLNGSFLYFRFSLEVKKSA